MKKIEFRYVVMVGCLIIIGILGTDIVKRYGGDIEKFFYNEYTITCESELRTTDNFNYEYPVIISFKSSKRLNDETIETIANDITLYSSRSVQLTPQAQKTSDSTNFITIFEYHEQSGYHNFYYDFYNSEKGLYIKTHISEITINIPNDTIINDDLHRDIKQRKQIILNEVKNLKRILEMETLLIKQKAESDALKLKASAGLSPREMLEIMSKN